MTGHEPYPCVVLDIDGTVCDNGHRNDWKNPESVNTRCRVIPTAFTRVREMLDAGWEPNFLTGRNGDLDRVTFDQLLRWFGPSMHRADVVTRGARDEWDDEPTIRRLRVLEHKRSWLAAMKRFWAPVIYVGDDDLDHQAALDAGVPFMTAEAWRLGAPIPVSRSPNEIPDQSLGVQEAGDGVARRVADVSPEVQDA